MCSVVRIAWTCYDEEGKHTRVKPEDHEGIILDKLELADFAFLEVECCDVCISCRAHSVHGIKDHAVDVDCLCQHAHIAKDQKTWPYIDAWT